jgi:hypothetical protein
VIETMSSLGGVAEAGRAALERHDTQAFALIGELMGTNFGGAIVCMRNEANADGLWFDGARELLIVDAFKSIGFQFERISVSKHTPFAV